MICSSMIGFDKVHPRSIVFRNEIFFPILFFYSYENGQCLNTWRKWRESPQIFQRKHGEDPNNA